MHKYLIIFFCLTFNIFLVFSQCGETGKGEFINQRVTKSTLQIMVDYYKNSVSDGKIYYVLGNNQYYIKVCNIGENVRHFTEKYLMRINNYENKSWQLVREFFYEENMIEYLLSFNESSINNYLYSIENKENKWQVYQYDYPKLLLKKCDICGEYYKQGTVHIEPMVVCSVCGKLYQKGSVHIHSW